LAPLPSFPKDEASVALINVLTGLDPKSVEQPNRMTELLLKEAEASDPQTRRWAVYGLGLLLDSRFSLESYKASRAMLVRGLHDTDSGLRQRSAEALGRFNPMRLRQGKQTVVDGMQEVGRALAEASRDINPKVRQASLDSLAQLIENNQHFEVSTPLPSDRLFMIGRQLLTDSSPKVRIASLKLLAALSATGGLEEENTQQIYLDTLSRLTDTDPEVIATAVLILYGNNSQRWPHHSHVSSDIASLVHASHLAHAQLSTLLAANIKTDMMVRKNLSDSDAGMALLRQLSRGADLGPRINATRLLMMSDKEKKNHAIEKRSEAILIYRNGLASNKLTEKLDGIAGLEELISIEGNQTRKSAANRDLINALEPGLDSPQPPVRWAAALASGEIDGEHNRLLYILGELLGMVDDEDIRAKALIILRKSSNPLAGTIIARSLEKENLKSFYVRSCNTSWYGYHAGQTAVILKGIVKPDCRQILVQGLAPDSVEMPATAGLIESPSQGRSPGLRPLVLVGGNGFLLCQTPFLPMPLAT